MTPPDEEVQEAVQDALRYARNTSARSQRQGLAYSLEADVEEMESAALLGVAEAAGSWDPRRGPFRKWAYIKVRFRVREARRAEGRMCSPAWREYMAGRVSLDGLDGDESASPDAGGEDHLTRIVIEGAVAGLPERERRVVEEHDLHGEFMRDVAAGMGICRSNANALLARGRARLRETLTDEKGEPGGP